jgi:hypothetical protein
MLAALAVAGLVLVGDTAAYATNPSGLPWRSGAHTGSFPADYTAFETWRGHALDGTLQYTDRGSWSGIESPWFFGYTWPGETIVAQPGWPEGSGGSLSKCAQGKYDSHWRTYGSNLAAAGGAPADTMTELMWEMNGNWWEWSATNVTTYINCWRKIVNAVHATDPTARFMWTINAHSGGVTGNPMSAYPGDTYVNVVGIDAYDHYPRSMNQTEFDTQANAVAGITWTYSQAAAHGKQYAIPEWGVEQPFDADHGGDNPFFVTAMQDWFRAHVASIYIESYFDAAQSTIFQPPAANPNSGAEYIAGLHA